MPQPSNIHVFMGYDAREALAYEICKHSIERRSSVPIHVHALMHRPLRQAGIFTRPWHMDAKGQWIDEVDGKPFSTEFAFTRFLVPELCRRNNITGKVIFVDCDFLWLADPKKLIDETPDKALSCVWHDYVGLGKTKMDGVKQESYPRKLWSSLMVFDVEKNSGLTPELVNTWTGTNLHNFRWLSDTQIGRLEESWNFIPGHSDKFDGIDAIHYTEGGPWMEEYENCPMADKWYAEKAHYESVNGKLPSKQLSLT